MDRAVELLRYLDIFLFVVIAAVSFYKWRRTRLAGSGWAAGAFAVLALVAVTGRVLPDDPGELVDAVQKAEIAALVFFPYLLFRFSQSFRRGWRWAGVAALAATVAVAVWALLLDYVPEEAQAQPPGFGSFLAAFLVQWSVLSAAVALRLWFSGSGRPTVARRRMRLLGTGSIGLSATLILAGATADGASSLVEASVQAAASASAVLFYLGLAPPSFVRRIWLQPEEEAVRAGLTALLSASDERSVAGDVLPHVLRISGGSGALVADAEGRVIESRGAPHERGDVLERSSLDDEVVVLDLHPGFLAVWIGPFGSYFGDAELELLETLTAFVRLALERAALFQKERSAREQLAVAQGVAGFGSWERHIDTNKVVWSDELYRLVGLDPATSQPSLDAFVDVVHPDDRARITELFADLSSRTDPYDIEYRIVRPDGSEGTLHARALVVTDAGGRARRIVGVAQDITDRKKVEEDLRRSRDEAEKANRAKSEFLSRMSHELRTPLNSVIGFAQVLELEGLTPEQYDSVEEILRGGRHLLALINEVLDIASIESGAMALSPEPVLLEEVVDEIVSMLRPLARKKGIEISITKPVDAVYALADRQRLKQVAVNLLSNAIKYNHAGGSAGISYRVRGDSVELSVANTGPGIPAKDLDRIFEPFERLGAESTEEEGTGLGLALTKRLVEAMDGEIDVASEVGAETVFTVHLRAVRSTVEPGGDPAIVGMDEHHRAMSGTVLYIEDNPSNMKLMEGILAHAPGMRLLTAMQGSVGLDLAREHRPDIVLLDVQLPDTSGDEVLRRLKTDPATGEIPVVMVSADATQGQIERTLLGGAHEYLSKPFDVRRLLEVIESAVEGRLSPRLAPEQQAPR